MARHIGLWLLLSCGTDRPPPAAVFALPSSQQAAEPGAPSTVIWLGGDVMVSVALREYVATFAEPASGLATIMAPLASVWQQDPGAFVVVNLETPIATRRYDTYSEPTRSRGPTPVHLNAPGWLAHGLARVGVDAVTLANNHALDQDDEGLLETIRAAHTAGLAVSGAGAGAERSWPLIVGPDGARVAMLSFFDGYYLVRGRAEPAVRDATAGVSRLNEASFDQVGQAAADHDAVIVHVHVLGELQRRPKSRWRWWSQRLAEAGASVIVVGGTHVPMPVETLNVGSREVPLIWGLGNLLSDMGSQANPRRRTTDDTPKNQSAQVREALMARLEFREGDVEVKFMAGWMHDDRFQRWHAHSDEGEIAFALLPMSNCIGEGAIPTTIADDRVERRRELADWIRRRHRHLLNATGLQPEPCRTVPFATGRDEPRATGIAQHWTPHRWAEHHLPELSVQWLRP